MTGRVLGLALVLVVLLPGCAPRSDGSDPAPDPAASGGVPTSEPTMPRSMAALGDSITRAFAACPGAGDCPESSWATGTASGLGSHAQRITEISGRAPAVHNLAVSGAKVSDLAGQVVEAVIAEVEYVTILIGANDACAPSEESMTPVDEVAVDFDRALSELVAGLPRAKILIVSVPDLARLWQVGRDREPVISTWEQFGICQSMLSDPRSTDAEARARRGRVRDRVESYNRVMAQACAKRSTCRTDNGAVFGYAFSIDMVSSADYWHPSMGGQRRIADVAWRAGYWP